MKKTLLTLFVLIAAIGLLAGAGFTGYRMGLANATTSTGPAFGRSFHMNPQLMQTDHFGRGFDHNQMMRPGGFNGRSTGYFAPIHFLWNIAVLGLVIWFAYWLFTKSGWQVTRKVEATPKTDSDNPPGN